MTTARGRAPVPDYIDDRSVPMVLVPLAYLRQRTSGTVRAPIVGDRRDPAVGRARPPGWVDRAAAKLRPPGPGHPHPPPATGDVHPGTARLVLALVTLASLTIGLAGLIIDVGIVRSVGLLVFCLVGVGSAPWQLNAALGLPARLALTALTGIGVLTLVPTAMVLAGTWLPSVALLLVATGCTALHRRGARRALADCGFTGWRQCWRAIAGSGPALRRRIRIPLRHTPVMLAAGLGALLCLVAAVTHRPLDPGPGGFLPQIGPNWYVGLALILLALVSAARMAERQLAVPVLLLVLVLALTPALVYDGPRSPFAATYVDLAQQIRTRHRTDSVVEVYNSWPGLFAATAWLCDVTGIRDPLRLVAFWPVLIGLVRIAALRYLFGQLPLTGFQCWAAIALTALIDLTGPSYFSPQSVGLVIGTAAYGLALAQRSSGLRQAMLLLAGSTLAVTHQLSAYIVGGVLIVLVLGGQLRPRWTPLLVLAPAGTWAILHPGAADRAPFPADVARPDSLAAHRAVGPPGLEPLPIVGSTATALLGALAILGVLALLGLLRHRHEPLSWALAGCPAIGLVVIAMNPDQLGGAAWAVAFGAPWLALLAVTAIPTPLRWRSRLAPLATTAALTAAALLAAFGLDATNVVRPSDVAALRHVRAQAGNAGQRMHYLLQLGPGGLPGPAPTHRGGYQPVTWAELGGPTVRLDVLGVAQPDRQVALLTDLLVRHSRQPVGAAELHAIWSPVSARYGEQHGLHRPDRFTALREALRGSPYWDVTFERDSTVVFRLAAARYPADGT